jgi:extradiol dioxygenase family protein
LESLAIEYLWALVVRPPSSLGGGGFVARCFDALPIPVDVPSMSGGNMQLTPFHLAIQVRDIKEAREFYGTKMGFQEGRSAENWIDFNMFGHQLVTHLSLEIGKTGKTSSISNPVDGHGVPVPHFGVVLNFADWELLASKVKHFISDFIVEPYMRFKGETGEQGTMFFLDPSGNALEFKAFKDIEAELFAR